MQLLKDFTIVCPVWPVLGGLCLSFDIKSFWISAPLSISTWRRRVYALLLCQRRSWTRPGEKMPSNSCMDPVKSFWRLQINTPRDQTCRGNSSFRTKLQSSEGRHSKKTHFQKLKKAFDLISSVCATLDWRIERCCWRLSLKLQKRKRGDGTVPVREGHHLLLQSHLSAAGAGAWTQSYTMLFTLMSVTLI